MLLNIRPKLFRGPPFLRNAIRGHTEFELVLRGADVVTALISLQRFTSDLQLTVHSVSLPQAELFPWSYGMKTGFLPQGRQLLQPVFTAWFIQTTLYILKLIWIRCHCHRWSPQEDKLTDWLATWLPVSTGLLTHRINLFTNILHPTLLRKHCAQKHSSFAGLKK